MVQGIIGGAIGAFVLLWLLSPPVDRDTEKKARDRRRMELFIIFGGFLIAWFFFKSWIVDKFKKKK